MLRSWAARSSNRRRVEMSVCASRSKIEVQCGCTTWSGIINTSPANNSDSVPEEIAIPGGPECGRARQWPRSPAQSGHCEKLPADFPDKSECLGRARLGQGRTGDAIQ